MPTHLPWHCIAKFLKQRVLPLYLWGRASICIYGDGRLFVAAGTVLRL